MALLLLLPAIFLGACLYAWYWWKSNGYDVVEAEMDKFPGPPTKFLFGNILEFPADPVDFTKYIMASYARYKSPMKFRIGPMSYCQVFKANHIEAVLTSKENLRKSRDYELVEDWLGRGLLTGTGQRWHKRRKQLTPAFHFQILKDFMPIYNEHAEQLVKYFKKNTVPDQPLDVCPILSRCTLDIICETAMGKQLDALEAGNSDYVKAISDFGTLYLQRVLSPWLWWGWLYYNLTPSGWKSARCLKIMHGFTRKVMKEREESARPGSDSAQSGKKRRLAFLDLLLEMKQKGELTDEEVREEVDTFMFAGHDTTATGLMWSIYCIGRHPEHQKKIQEELDDLLGPDPAAWPAAEDLPNMKFLERCVKESQRIYPSVPGIARKVEVPIKLDDKYTVPAGVEVWLQFSSLHRDPEVFPDPMRYDPDRFTPENSAGRHPFAFCPFSAGLRNCIGQKFAFMEIKVVLCHLLKNFNIVSMDKEEDMKPANLLVLRPTNGVWVKLIPR